MIYKVYAIYDRALEAYTSPMFFRANGEALRAFMDEAARADSKINVHPEDFAIWFVGTWNEDTGELLGLEEPMLLARAYDLEPMKE